nr:allantoate transporter [Kwoniella pini CBS 10737]OCF52654.1 allantoate transporter [Kwoniella pini CBS 10737]
MIKLTKDDKGSAEHIEQPIIDETTELEAGQRQKHNANKQLDEAADILRDHGGHVEYTVDDSKRILRKIDIFVCIPMCIVYLVQQLDKGTVAQAAVFDLKESTGLVGAQYSWLTSVVYLAQLCCQPLSSYALVVFPVKYWVLFNYAAWSIVTICTAAATNFTGLIIARVLLGAFEATILPSFVLITQMWWTRREQSYRTIAYQIANSAAAIFGPLIAFGVGHVSSSIRPYQGIFLCMGAISLAGIPVVWYLLPNSPTTAKFLRKGDDRLIALDRLKENNTGGKSGEWKWNQVKETYTDPKTYMWALMYLCTSTPAGGFGAFSGLITKGFGFDSFQSILMQIPTGVIGIITLLIGIYFTNKFKARWLVIAIITLFPIAGASAMVNVNRSKSGALLASYYIAYPLAGIQPLLYSWANLNQAGTTKRVVVFATMFVFQCAGNVIGPQVYLEREAPVYQTGLYTDIGCWVVLFCLIIAMRFYLGALNRKQARRRAAMGLPEDLQDMSIMSQQEATTYKIELTERMKDQGMDETRLYENAFEDMTDYE